MKRNLTISYFKVYKDGTIGCEMCQDSWTIDDTDTDELSSVLYDVESVCIENKYKAIIDDEDADFEQENPTLAVCTYTNDGNAAWSIDDDSIFSESLIDWHDDEATPDTF